MHDGDVVKFEKFTHDIFIVLCVERGATPLSWLLGRARPQGMPIGAGHLRGDGMGRMSTRLFRTRIPTGHQFAFRIRGTKSSINKENDLASARSLAREANREQRERNSAKNSHNTGFGEPDARKG